MGRVVVFFAGLGLVVAAAALRGQGSPLGAEQTINTYTTGYQCCPRVASNVQGDFVVVWDSGDFFGAGQDGSGYGVFAQRFASTGVKTGAEFRVNTYTTDEQWKADLACDPAGNCVVTWDTYAAQDGSGSAVEAQRFDTAGAPIGGEFQVNTYTTGPQGSSRVAMGTDGAFVVVWNTYDGDRGGVFGQRFDTSGSRVGLEFQVNTETLDDQVGPLVAVDRFGGFVVVWTSNRQDGSGYGVFGQRFDGSGVRVGPEFQVNTYTTSRQLGTSVAVDRSGGFVVVWESLSQDDSGYGVFGQRFDRSGTRIGSEFQINSETTDDQWLPRVATLSTGDFLVVWTGQDADRQGIVGQRFDRSGAKIGSEFQVNAYTTFEQYLPAVAADGRGGFAVVWQTDIQDGSHRGTAGRSTNLLAKAMLVDAHASDETNSDLNGVLEPGEIVLVETAWRNVSDADIPLTGAGSSLSGPSGGTYLLSHTSADYGTIASGSTNNCYDGNAAHDCYLVAVSGPRAATHWDAQFREDLSTNGGNPWRLHLGDSFIDVPRSQPFYKKIETMLHNGITGGCTPTTYCPGGFVSRAEMAIFIAKAIEGDGAHVPASGLLSGVPYDCRPGGASLFADVAPTDSACKHVHDIAFENVTLGCGAGSYCPNVVVTRDAMASFIAKAFVSPSGGAGVPVSYGPDPKTGRSYSCDNGSPTVHFDDVPAPNAFCKHIHFLWAKGIVDGCSATSYCPGEVVRRDAMAKFIVNAFDLQLYGP